MKNTAIISRDLLKSKNIVQAFKKDLTELNKGGQFFTVTFETKTGKIRSMNCRTGVKRYLKGGKSTIDHVDNLLSVYDVKACGYRCISLDKMIKIRSNGNEIIFK